ncbi:hypothetical protein AHAS_Ahas05G0073900 [Arachis hypogaea]
MEEAFPFSSLEHATSFARDLWFNTLPVQSWLDAFSAHRHIGDAITIAHGESRMVWLFVLLSKLGHDVVVVLDIIHRIGYLQ